MVSWYDLGLRPQELSCAWSGSIIQINALAEFVKTTPPPDEGRRAEAWDVVVGLDLVAVRKADAGVGQLGKFGRVARRH